MHHIKRRSVLSSFGGISAAIGMAGVAGLAGLAQPAWAQSGKVKPLAPKLRIVIPAATRTNLDDASRSLGDALLGLGFCDELEYENHDARGGTQGVLVFGDKYSKDVNSFFMADTSLIGALAVQKPSANLDKLTPIARLTTDHLVIVVPANSPLKTVKDLADRLRTAPKQTPLAISAMGGVDHIFASLLVKWTGSKPEDASYPAFGRRHELVDAVLSGKAAAGISSHLAFGPDLQSGKLRALGVSSKKAAFGIAAVREQGVDVDITNWCAVFTGQAVPEPRKAEMLLAVKKAVTYDLWKATLNQSYWESSLMSGPDLTSFIEIDGNALKLIAQLLKLKA